MFFLSRYLPIGRSLPETTDSDSEVAASSPMQHRQGIEMAVVGRRVQQNFETRSDSPRFEEFSPSSSLNEDAFEDIHDEEGPSASAIVAVRLCVWSFFLFAFLILFQSQQEKFNSDRSRVSSRLRSSQLVHMQVPWMGFSGFRDHSTNLLGHFVDTNSSTLSISKLNAGMTSLTCRRLGSDPITINDSTIDLGSEPLHAIQPLSNGQMVSVVKSGDQFSFVFQAKRFEFGKNFDLVLFQLIANSNSLVVVLRPQSVAAVDCLNTFRLVANTSSVECVSSQPILRANAYFFDEAFSNLVSVGTDDWTRDSAGNSMHGVFVQSFHDQAVDFSVSIPFIHRANDGLWAFQNAPLSQGFVVLVPTIGFPAQPVQHLVSIRPGSPEYPKGSVFRLESPELSLFRKVDTLKFVPPSLDTSLCGCSTLR